MIDEALAAFLRGGNSMIVATRSAALEPFVTRAAAVRVLGPQRLAVLLPRATSARCIADLKNNGEIALCVCSPQNFRTFQLKGRSQEIEPAGPEDVQLAEEQLGVFTEATLPFGNSRALCRNLWLFDCWRVEVEVRQIFTQTPGPGAGARLEGGGGA